MYFFCEKKNKVKKTCGFTFSQRQTEEDDDFSESTQSQLISDEKIAIPKDLFNDFQALKSATHLDTAQLMRTLIKDYAQLKAAGIVTSDTQPSRPESILSNHSNHSSLSDTDKLSEYYRQDQSDDQQ
ncbi:hypothetical protein KUTeg_001395 [Tegillarca granosa]|uniref:Uncharacterized protein n=1 Tax=Tegillarca granosa TaxID=220873 RepID=A0ABQ9FRC2_TEGGR|nr:hypothetical protein KUTeg_001395 [Tegillarca granosa]